jgi:hypothetical protein
MEYKDIIIDNNSEDFISRVMNENLWNRDYTLRVIEEYKKFIWLSVKMAVSPSHQIDQVWHTHILYTKDYTDMCNTLAGQYIHHNPTNSKDKTIQGIKPYNNTKKGYEDHFGIPPSDIWTDFKQSKYVFIDISRLWILPAGDWKTLLKLLYKQLKFKIYGIS